MTGWVVLCYAFYGGSEYLKQQSRYTPVGLCGKCVSDVGLVGAAIRSFRIPFLLFPAKESREFPQSFIRSSFRGLATPKRRSR